MKELTLKVKEAVYQQTTFLSGLEKPTLEQLLTMAQSDRRVRNVTPLYALFYEQQKWRNLYHKERSVASLNLQFKKALERLEDTSTETVTEVARDMKNVFYSHSVTHVEMLQEDVSNEMAKLVQSVVRTVKLTERVSRMDTKKLDERLSKVNYNNLFTKKAVKS